MKRSAIWVYGDAQAEAVALVLRRLADVTSAYEILYCDSRRRVEKMERSRDFIFAYSFEQQGTRPPYLSSLPRACRRVVFPALHLRLLWPLAVASNGRLPWGDSFIAACVNQGVPAADIMRYYEAPVWSASWPNLDVLFKEESIGLSSADAQADVKIGSFVLKHFRKRRLFWAPNAPTNDLLAELVYRLLHAAFGPAQIPSRESVNAALSGISQNDLMAHVALPVHPLVARHFGLVWGDPAERFTEFYREMIVSASR